MRFQFIHAADLHLDTPFIGLHRVNPRLATILRDATVQAFENLVKAAIDRAVSFVAIAGDVYDGPERGVRAQLAFRDGLERLSQAGIPAFLVHGNHDPVDEGWSAIRQWPPLVTVFQPGAVATARVQRDGQTIAMVQGVSYPRRAVTENLARSFHRDSTDCFQVGLLHCNVGGNTDHETYSPCSIDDLLTTGIDYWALGHIHARQVLHDAGQWIVYPGDLQGLSLKPSERGAKGAYVLEVDGRTVTSAEFAELDVVRFDDVTIDITTATDLAGVIDAVVEAAQARANHHGGRAVVLRATLIGHGAVYRDLQRGHINEMVVVPAREMLESTTQDVWLDAIEDCTHPEIDVASLRGRGDFAGDLVNAADAMLEPEAPRGRLLADSLAGLSVADLRRVIGDDVDAAPTDEEIRGALEMALERMTGAE